MKIVAGQLWIVFSLTLVLSSCDPIYEMRMSQSYVTCYNELRSIQLSAIPANNGAIMINCGNDLPAVSFHLNSTGEEKEEYLRLCQKHNDLTYNQYVSVPRNRPPEKIIYNDQDFVSIEITSDSSFDDTHPEGSNLADIVRFLSWSPYKFISSGYSTYYYYDSDGLSEAFNTLMPLYYDNDHFDKDTAQTWFPVDKRVSELTSEDLILLEGPWLIGILVFEERPKNSGSHLINVKMLSDTGKVFESSLRLSF